MFPRSLLTVLVASCLAVSAIVLGVGSAAGQAGAGASRVCPVSTSPTRFECLSEIRTNQNGQPLVSADTPSGYGPAQFHTAYNLPTTSATNQTIAIVDAYANPNVYSNLQTYDQRFGLPAFPLCSTSQQSACLAILNQNGSTSGLPSGDSGWGLEISLDVQVAHAICQNCRINLYEANSDYTSDLDTAVNTAAVEGANVISNSYGSFLYECNDTAYNHPSVAVVVSSGDDGYGVACPASMNTVVSVGGTSLYLNGSGGYGSENVWWNDYGGTGSGCSSLNPAPSWQTSNANWSSIACGGGRGMNDVSADADPGTGASVYDSYGYGGWVVMGGTSLSAPLIAGVYGLAASASSYAYPAQSVYQSPGSLHDVTSGSNGYCYDYLQCDAGSGYDLPTGIGTPNGLGGFSATSSSGPANDNLSAAQIVTDSAGTVSGSNVDATSEIGEPENTPESSPIQSVWYAWTAPATGNAVVDTCGSDFDTTLGVYSGSAVNALTPIVSNDDDTAGCVGYTSRVTFPATSGTTYQISVDGYDTDSGAITLNYQLVATAPVNDNFAGATTVLGSAGTATGSNVNATSEPGEPANTPESVPTNSVWFAWQAPSAGTMVLDTCGSGFDTTLGVYTGSAVNALTTVAANDDDPLAICGHKSRVTFDAAAGQTYYYSVDGYGSREGAITLNWNFGGSDTTPPVVSSPTGVIIAPQSLGSTARVHVTWTATDPSGVVLDELQMKKGTGAWTALTLSSPTATSADTTLTVGATYRFRVRATDTSGNTSAWATTSAAKLRVVQENAKSITYSGTWKRASLAAASGGYVKYATTSTARAKLTFTGAAASFVTTVSSARGICEIWIDGSLATTFDTYSASTTKKQIVFATPRLNYGSHTIEIRVKGSKRSASTSPRVDVDAFLTWP